MPSRKLTARLSPALALLTLSIATACSASQEPAQASAASSEATAEAALPPKADAEALDLGLRQYSDLRQMASLDDRCHWLEPIARTALDVATEERLAWYVSQEGDPALAQARAEEAIAQRADQTCAVLQSQGLDKAIQLASWQMRITWATAGNALISDASTDQWMSGKSTVVAHGDSLKTAVAPLREKYDVSDEIVASISKQAREFLATRCTGAEEISCPATPDDAAYRRYAGIWLTGVETYAAALDKAEDKTGTPPDMK